MESGHVAIAELDGPFDLQSTLESGQSYLWERADGENYSDLAAHGGDSWYETVLPPTPGLTERPTLLRVRQVGGVDDGRLEWEAGGVELSEWGAGPYHPTESADGEALLTHLLRLDDDLTAIYDATDDQQLVQRAVERYRGMRLVRDPPFPCLVSFICSAQMRVARIHGMQRSLREAYGTPVSLGDRTLYSYPTPAALAARSEQDLRDLRLGYRAPYVQRTAEMVAEGEADPADARGKPYEEARNYLTQFVGVGDKVADCVLLFSLGYLQAAPLDTWIRTAIEEYFPDCETGGYVETSRAIRERLGGDLPERDEVFGESGADAYAGYAQTYVFHHLRSSRS
ncbi:MAG: DNA-3-methyladenine glycosylase [Halolamina sp.]